MQNHSVICRLLYLLIDSIIKGNPPIVEIAKNIINETRKAKETPLTFTIKFNRTGIPTPKINMYIK